MNKFKSIKRSLFQALLYFILACLFSTAPLKAQHLKIQSLSALSEKIYLQLDRKTYTTDETIWIKGIVTEGLHHAPSQLSSILYVQLIGPDEKVKDEKVMKLSNGLGDNFFDLSPKYPEGKYLIRAYTQWNNNFGDRFVFEEYIDIFPALDQKQDSPINNVFLSERSPGEFWLNARFLPKIIDSLHQKKLDIYLDINQKRDTLKLKAEANDLYTLAYPVDVESNLATLSISTENGQRFTKTFSLGQDNIDLQFFPEGGDMIHGQISKIGFKAVDQKGKGITVKGNIVNNEGEIITDFEGNHLGMGTLFLLPDSTKQYFASISSLKDTSLSFQYPLPQAKPQGQSFSIIRGENKIRLVSVNSKPINDSVFIQIKCRGIEYYMMKGRLRKGEMMVPLSKSNLPEGVLSFTLLDKNRQPVAERLYFNERPENRLKVQAKTDTSTYLQRKKTAIDIRVLDPEDKPEKVNLSVLVINSDLIGESQQNRQNILSQLLLNADLKGEIENPGYYFDTHNDQRHQDMEALMLTQGWRRYNYTQELDSIIYQPETSLHVSGTVGGVLSPKKKKEGAALTLMTFGDKPYFQAQNTDSLGRFHFPIPDAFGHKLNILIQSANKSGKNKNYTITLDKSPFPPFDFDHRKSIEDLDSTQFALITQQQEKNKVDRAFRLSNDAFELEEVIVEDYLMTSEREKVTKRFGKPDKVIGGEEIQEKEEKWSYGLYSVLLFNYPEIRIERMEATYGEDSLGGPEGSYLKATIPGGEETLVVIDGIPVINYNYDLIPNIPPSEVKSVELIRFANRFSELYMEVYPQANPLEIPMTGNVIAIYTLAGKGIFSVQQPPGILKAAIPLYSPSKEFYTPKYQHISSEDWVKPDLRTLVHWQPQVITDENGKATVSFYNGDITGNIMIVIEAISENGNIGYQELVYKVTKSEITISN
ncbi:hypothetical protein KZP23_12725 [Echinicola marina]|uniref:hypothetical protein n=1 Tax=Echinicola marina TaxID=2859768 RepID=UPI001CF6BAC4|nr:hypothetical protein [Echinicola marina]UCS91617.1 hypothetical protein KZP23_12725 [Echinicola marina]